MQETQLTLINQKMPIFKGCTLQEVGIVFFLIYSISFVLLSVLSEAVFATILPAVVCNIVPAILFSWMAIKLIARLKEGKPIGYSQVKINLWLAGLGLKKNPYVIESKQWSIRRHV